MRRPIQLDVRTSAGDTSPAITISCPPGHGFRIVGLSGSVLDTAALAAKEITYAITQAGKGSFISRIGTCDAGNTLFFGGMIGAGIHSGSPLPGGAECFPLPDFLWDADASISLQSGSAGYQFNGWSVWIEFWQLGEASLSGPRRLAR